MRRNMQALEVDASLSSIQKEEAWVLIQQLYYKEITSKVHLKSTYQVIGAQSSQITFSLCTGMLLGLGATTLTGRFSLFNMGVCSIFFTTIINASLKLSESNVHKKLYQIELTTKNQSQTTNGSLFTHVINTTAQPHRNTQHLAISDESQNLTHPNYSVSGVSSNQSKIEKKSRQFLKDLSRGLFFKPNITGSDIEKDAWNCLDTLCEKTSGHKLFTPNRTGTELEKQARQFMSNFKFG